MQTYRFGIIGSGYMGRTHAEAIHRVPGAELVAVAGVVAHLRFLRITK